MIEYYKNINIINLTKNSFNKQDLVLENGIIKFIGKNYNGKADEIIESNNLVCCNNFFYLNLIDNLNYGWFNLSNISKTNLEKQLTGFYKNNKTPILLIENVIEVVNYFETLIPFIKQNGVKLIIKIGTTLDEMGLCDKLYNQTPVELIESYGLLDLNPIILGATNLDKSDFEILSYYNTTICLNLTKDLLSGNGIAPILTIKNYNLNIILASEINNVFKEMFLCYVLPCGVLNSPKIINAFDVLKMATINVKDFNINNEIVAGNKANIIIFKFNKIEDDVAEKIIFEGENNILKIFKNGIETKN